MAVEHYPKNATVKIPIDVVLFNGTTQQTGEAANITVRYICLDNGQTYDWNDNTFKQTPTTPTQGVTAFTGYTYDYYHVLNVSAAAWKRGHYRALFRHSSSGKEYAFDFTLGLCTPKQLGISAVYDGSTLRASLWVEELGEVQSDYISLDNVTIRTSSGATLSVVGNLTVPTNGVFNFSHVVGLDAITQYVIDADATIGGYNGANYVFKLRQALVRP